MMGAQTAFEIDSATLAPRSGWSVVVVGHAARIREPGPLEEVRALPLDNWAPGVHDDYYRIPCEHVTGRSFGPEV